MVDHDEIRRWAEARDGRPARVKGTGKGEDPGLLRIDFGSKSEALEEITWDKWFRWFDRNRLAVLHSPTSCFSAVVRR